MTELVRHLKKIVSSESGALSDAVLYAVAREADGSMRDGQSLLEQLMAFSGEDLSDEEILDVLGVVDRRSVLRVADAVLDGDARTCMDVVGEIYRRGIDIRRFCQQLCDHFRNVLFVALGGHGGGDLEFPAEEVESLRKQASRSSPDSLYVYFQTVLKGEEEIRWSSLPRISLEMLLLRLSQLPRLETLAQAMETLKAMERRLAGGERRGVSMQPVQPSEAPRPTESTGKSTPVSAGPDEEQLWQADVSRAEATALELGDSESDSSFGVSVTQSAVVSKPAAATASAPLRTSPLDNEHWPSFLRWLEGPHPRLAAKLGQSRLVRVSDTEAELEAMELFAERLRNPEVLAKLTSAATSYFDRSVTWKIGVLAAVQTDLQSPARTGRPKVNPRRIVMENPMVQQALEILGGEILDIKTLKKGKRSEDASE
jgi:DNA polymerase-3 subunit gamma/tau